MARRVIVKMLCDPCLAGGVEVEAEELPAMTLTGNKPRVLALCESHRNEVYDPLVAMLKDHGQIVDIEPATGTASAPKAAKKTAAAKAPAPGVSGEVQYHCPECREAGEPRSFTAPQGLGAHRYRAHGVESASKQEKAAG
jgi:hypothetical protein